MTILEQVKEEDEISLHDLNRLFPEKGMPKLIKSLLEEGWLLVKEEIQERYKPLQEARIRLRDAYRDDAGLETVFLQLEQDKRKKPATGNTVGFSETEVGSSRDRLCPEISLNGA